MMKLELILITVSLFVLQACNEGISVKLFKRSQQVPILELVDSQSLPLTMSLTFPEAVVGLSQESFEVENASVLSVDGSGASYIVKFWPNAVGSIKVSLRGKTVSYQSGKKSPASNKLDVVFADASPQPGSSGDVSGAFLSPEMIRLSWESAIDSVTTAERIKYEIYVSSSNNIASLEGARLNGNLVASSILGQTFVDLSVSDLNLTSWVTLIASDEFGNQVAYNTINLSELTKIKIDSDQFIDGNVLYSLTQQRLQQTTLNAGSHAGSTVVSLPAIQGRFMVKSGTYLYIVSNDGLSLNTYNISTPSSPSLVSTVVLPSPATLGRLSGVLLMLSHGTNNIITIWSLTDQTLPALVKTHTTGVANCVDLIHFANLLFALNRDDATISSYSLNSGSPSASAYVRSMDLAGPAGFSRPNKMISEDRQFWVSFDGTVGGIGYYDVLEYFGRILGQYTGLKVSNFVHDRNRVFAFGVNQADVSVLNVSNPKSISVIKNLTISRSGTYELSNVRLSNNRIYLAEGPDLSDIGVTSEIEPISQWHTLATGSYASASGFAPSALTYDSNHLFVGNSSNFGLQVYNITNVASPALVSESLHTGAIAQVEVNSTYIVTLTTAGVLRIYDRSQVSNLSSALLGQTTLSQTVNLVDMKLHGSRAYISVAGTADRLLSVSLAVPSSPTQEADLILADNPGAMALSNNTLYVIEQSTKQIAVIDLTQGTLAVASRVPVSSDIIGSPTSIAVSGTRLYVGIWGANWGWGDSTGYAGVSVINISNPNTPVEQEFYRYFTGANIGVSRGYIWMSHFYLNFSPQLVYNKNGDHPFNEHVSYTNYFPSSVSFFRGFDDYIFGVFGSGVRYLKTEGDVQFNQ